MAAPAPAPEPDPAPAPVPAGRRREQIAAWLGAGILLALVLAIGGVHAPARIKLLGLFPLAYGLAVGGLLSALARQWALRGRWLSAAAAAIVVCGLVVMALESHRLRRQALDAAPRHDPGTLLIEEMFQSAPAPEDPEQRAGHEAMRRTLERSARERELTRERARSFSGYLAHRTRALGAWTAPWPQLLWGLELLLAGTAAAWLLRRPLGWPGLDEA